MAEGPREEAPYPRLGLDRLSADGIILLKDFIRQDINGGLEKRLGEAFDEELHGMPERDLENARARIEELAGSDDSEYRETACDLVPYLAQSDPDSGFPLWRKLMRDPDGSVADAAACALARQLGVLVLDIQRVVELIDVHFQTAG